MIVMTKRLMLMIPAVLASTLASAELVIESGHVRALLPGAASTAAYMTLNNTGDVDVIIKAVKSPAAAQVTIHGTMNHSGMFHMMAMDSLKVAAKKQVILEPNGTHLMLEKPLVPIAVGGKIELIFQMSDGSTQAISLPVKSVLSEK